MYNATLVVMMFEDLPFASDTNDVVNSLKMMERKIKEFQRHPSIDITLKDNVLRDGEFKEANVFKMDDRTSIERRRLLSARA